MAMSQGVQRIVAIALLVLVFAVIWRLALQPAWRHWQSGEEFIDQQLNTIARLRAISSSQAQYSATLAKVKSDSGVDAQLMKSASATLAAAQLQQQLKTLVESAGGSVVSSQPKDASDEGPFTRVGLNVRMLVSISALQQVMYALETQSPLVMIDEVLVLSRGRRKARTSRTDGMLDVRINVAGFVRRAVRGEAANG